MSYSIQKLLFFSVVVKLIKVTALLLKDASNVIIER